MRLMTLDEVSKQLKMGKTTLYKYLNSGALPAKKLGGKTLILDTDLENFISNIANFDPESEKAS